MALAEEAYAASPSSGSRYGLLHVVALRAVTTLAAQDDQFADFVSRTRRSLWPSLMLAVTLSRGGSLAANVMANDDVERIAILLKQSLRLFPKESDPWKWAFLQAIDTQAAAEIAERVKTHEFSRMGRRIDRLMTPVATSTALDAYWEMSILGQNEQANQVLKESAEKGMPLPFEIENY